MTSLQIQAADLKRSYQELYEKQRHNVAEEAEKRRHDLADEEVRAREQAAKERDYKAQHGLKAIEWISRLLMPDASVGPFKKDQW